MKTAAELHDLGQRNPDGLVTYCLDLQDMLDAATKRLALTSRNSSKSTSLDG